MPDRGVLARVVRRCDQHLLEGAELFHAKTFFLRPAGLEGEIDALSDQIDVFVVADDFNIDMRMPIDEHRDNGAQQGRGERAGRRDAQQPGRFVAQLPDAVDRLTKSGEEFLGGEKERASGIGGRDFPGAAQDELGIDFRLEPAKVFAYQRLRNPQTFRGRGKAAFFDHGHKNAKVIKIPDSPLDHFSPRRRQPIKRPKRPNPAPP